MKPFVIDCKMLILELKWKLSTWEFTDVTRFWTQTQVATRGTLAFWHNRFLAAFFLSLRLLPGSSQMLMCALHNHLIYSEGDASLQNKHHVASKKSFK